MANVKIAFELRRRPVDGDGSRCVCCRDNVYGMAAELVLVTKKGAELGILEEQMCQACADATGIKEMEEGGE